MRSLFIYLTALMALIMIPAIASATGMTPLKQLPDGDYVLDKSHASLHFKVSHLGLSNYTARFTDFESTLTLDPAAPENSTITASVNPLSIETDYPKPEEKDFDKKLSEDEHWLNGLKFSKITFESTKLTRINANTGTLEGNLTMLGVTKPVSFDVTLNGAYENKPFANVPALGVSASGTIKRSEWGFDTYVPNIGDDVEIIMELEFHKAAGAKK